MSHASVIVALDENPQDVEINVGYQMEPFNENDKCFRDGSRWDWYQIGGRYAGKFLGSDTILAGDILQEKFRCHREPVLRENWHKAMSEVAKDGKFPVELVYNFDPREKSEDAFVSELLARSWFPGGYAFLRNRHWHEPERMGWFGGTAKTECERKNPEDIDIAANKCITKDDTTGARIVVWNEPFELWQEHFYHRFIERLPHNTLLVTVDYHV